MWDRLRDAVWRGENRRPAPFRDDTNDGMGRKSHFASWRAALAIFVCGAAAALGCANLLGIDDGIPATDASQSDAMTSESAASDDADVTASLSDSTVVGEGDDHTLPSEASNADGDDSLGQTDALRSDARDDARDTGIDAFEACTPNETFCQNRCSPGTDSCGVQWNCPNNCPTGWGCNPVNSQCLCTRFATGAPAAVE